MPNSFKPIYLISLKQNVKRREALANRFHEKYSEFNVIDAVDGKTLDSKTYFSALSKYYLRTKKIMTPSELGCTLSHIKALETFLASNATKALFFEDDVIGSDESLSKVESLANLLPDNGVLLLGCQDGVSATRWHYGKRITGTNLYKVSRFSYQYFYRSCAYSVTRRSAQLMLERLKHPALADEWPYLLKDGMGLYFVKLFSHPVDLKDSAIESERAFFNRRLWVGKLWDVSFYIRNISALIFCIFALFLGHKRIKS